jgi:hypothetical protein
MLVTREIFPLARAVECIQQRLESQTGGEDEERTEFQ